MEGKHCSRKWSPVKRHRDWTRHREMARQCSPRQASRRSLAARRRRRGRSRTSRTGELNSRPGASPTDAGRVRAASSRSCTLFTVLCSVNEKPHPLALPCEASAERSDQDRSWQSGQLATQRPVRRALRMTASSVHRCSRPKCGLTIVLAHNIIRTDDMSIHQHGKDLGSSSVVSSRRSRPPRSRVEHFNVLI